ncbi:MAG: hypothetical protein KatS3mg080_0189 [Anoxybacillus sp.]|nr:MAG: hypothetical protein KatS3mg080_0189 [Anoxybacillus sp.]
MLDTLSFQESAVPVISNVTAEPMTNPTEIKQRLVEQLYSPVRWEQSVQTMIDLGVHTFIEIGPGKVLSGLVKKINRHVNVYSIFDEASFAATVTALKGE